MKQQAWGLTDLGRVRQSNEDTFVCDPELGIYLVCDGMGGHAAGEVASRIAADTVMKVLKTHIGILNTYAKSPSFANRMAAVALVRESIETCCNAVYQEALADPEKKGMATTIVAVVLCGFNAIIAHVGDSRAYLIRKNQAHQLTDDHSLVTEQMARGIITPDEAAKSKMKSVTTRCIGHQECVEVDTLQIEVAPGDVILLGSDGLTDYFPTREIGDFMAKTTVDGLAKLLIDQANVRGGRDNITAIVVSVDPGQTGPLGDPIKKLDVLRRISLFKQMDYRDLLRILSAATLRTCAAGEYVVREGDATGGLFINISGTIEISKNGRKLASIPPGQFVGEMSLMDNSPRSADIIAVEPTRLMVLDRDDVGALMRQNPFLAIRLLTAICKVLNQRLRTTSDELVQFKALPSDNNNATGMGEFKTTDGV